MGELEIALLFPLCVASFAPFLFALSPRLYWTTAKGWMRWEVKERKDFYFWRKSGTCTVAFWLPAPPADFWIILYSPCTVSRRLHSNRGQDEPYLAGLFPSLWVMALSDETRNALYVASMGHPRPIRKHKSIDAYLYPQTRSPHM